jgi:hypothetical protein
VKRLAVERVVHRSGERSTAILDRDRHRERGDAVNEVRGAVERIHHPAILGDVRFGHGFFGENRVVREAPADVVRNRRLGLAIDLRHEVVQSLFLDTERLLGAKALAKDLARQACRLARGTLERFRTRHGWASRRHGARADGRGHRPA